MARKQILSDLLQQAYEVETAFIAGLTDEEKTRTGSVENWSDKDVIAHIAVWKERRVSDIQAVVKGGEPTNIQDFDHENELIFNEIVMFLIILSPQFRIYHFLNQHYERNSGSQA